MMKLKLFIVLTLCLFLSCSTKNKNIMTEKEFNQLIDDSNSYLKEKIEWCKTEYKIGDYERYDWNQDTGEIVFSDKGVKKVIAKIQFVGSVSNISKTWLWSWDNPTISDAVKKDINVVKAFGEKYHLKKLTTAKWPAEEADGWEMTAIAAKLLTAKGAYRSPDSDGFTFLIFTDIYWAKNK